MFTLNLNRPNYTAHFQELHDLIAEGVDGFRGLTHEGSSLQLFFESDPGDEVKKSITEVVDTYQKGQRFCRIYDYMPAYLVNDYLTPPFELDFTVVVQPEPEKVITKVWQGDILEVDFHIEFDPATQKYSNPIVKRTYQIDYFPAQLRVSVVETLQWYRVDGVLHPSAKVMKRNYCGQRYWSWWSSKRHRIIEWLKHNVALAMMANLLPDGWALEQIVAEGQMFFDEHGPHIFAYMEGGARGLSEAIQKDGREWLSGPWPGEEMSILEKMTEQLKA